MIQEWRDPEFLVLEPDESDLHERPGGVEVKVDNALEIQSPQYRRAVQHKEVRTLAEEKRILYVAVTRAQQGCYVVGSVPDGHGEEQSWRSLILEAQGALEANGAAILTAD
jgi:ATP-dependent exoDNAse (exonuclease V) beta subunit